MSAALASNQSASRAPEEEDPEYEEEEEEYDEEKEEGGSGMTSLLAGGAGFIALAVAVAIIICCVVGRGKSESNQETKSPAEPPKAPAVAGSGPGKQDEPPAVVPVNSPEEPQAPENSANEPPTPPNRSQRSKASVANGWGSSRDGTSRAGGATIGYVKDNTKGVLTFCGGLLMVVLAILAKFRPSFFGSPDMLNDQRGNIGVIVTGALGALCFLFGSYSMCKPSSKDKED